MIKVIFLAVFCLLYLPGLTQEARLYRENDKIGLLSTENKPITKAIYDHIVPGVPYSVVKKYNAATARYVAGCVDGSGELVIPMAYTDLKVAGLRIIACQKSPDGFVYGVLSLKNEVLIPIQYRSIQALGTLRFAVENVDGKIALFSESGVALTNFTIDRLHPFHGSVCQFEQDGKVGLMSRDGSIAAQAIYRNIVQQPDGSFLARRSDVWQWITDRNEVRRSLECDTLHFLSSECSIVRERNGDRIVDASMKPTSRYYRHITPTGHPDLLMVADGQKGIIGRDGRSVLPLMFDSVYVTRRYLYGRTGKGWQVFLKSGKSLSERSYDVIVEDSVFLRVKKNNYWGALDETGREKVACVYDSILETRAAQLAVQFRGKFGMISPDEHWLVPLQEHPVLPINDSHYVVREGSLFTVKNFTHDIIYFTNNKLSVTDDGFVETTGIGELWHVSWTGVVTRVQQAPVHAVASIEPEYEGYRAIYKNGKWGFVDRQGRLRIPNRYDKVKHFSEGLAPFSLRNRWGFLNKEDEIVYHPAYDDADPFENGLSKVKQKGFYGLINKSNQLVLPCRYSSVHRLSSGFFELTSGSLFGLADSEGTLIYEPKFDSQVITSREILVRRDGKFGVLDFSGISTVPMIYDYLSPATEGVFLTYRKGETVVLRPE